MIILIFTYTYPFHTIWPVRYIFGLRVISRIKKSFIIIGITSASLTRILWLLLFHFMIHYSVAKLTCPVLIYIVIRKILHNHYVVFDTTQSTFILYIYYFLRLYTFTMIYNDSQWFTMIHNDSFIRLSSQKKVLVHTHTTYLTLSYLALSVVPFTLRHCSCCSPTCWEHRG